MSANAYGPQGAILAPVVAGLVALSVHWFLPNREPPPPSWLDRLPAWQHPYPLLLGALVAAALVWAVAQWLCGKPLTPQPPLPQGGERGSQTVCPPLAPRWERGLGGEGASRLRRWSWEHAPLVAGAVAVVCIWDLIMMKWGWVGQPHCHGPDDVLGALIEDRALLFESTWHSLRLLLCGYFVGVALGLVSGVLIGWFAGARYWGMPVLKFAGPMPATALVGFAMILFSTSPFSSAVALIAYAVIFPMTMLTSSGIANVRISYLDVARTLGAGRLYLIFRVAIPAAMPNIFLGLFVGLLTSFLTLVVAETVGVKAGLGWYLKWQQGYMEYGKVYAALVIMAIFFSTIMTLLFKVRDHVLKWQKGVIKW